MCRGKYWQKQKTRKQPQKNKRQKTFIAIVEVNREQRDTIEIAIQKSKVRPYLAGKERQVTGWFIASHHDELGELVHAFYVIRDTSFFRFVMIVKALRHALNPAG